MITPPALLLLGLALVVLCIATMIYFVATRAAKRVEDVITAAAVVVSRERAKALELQHEAELRQKQLAFTP